MSQIKRVYTVHGGKVVSFPIQEQKGDKIVKLQKPEAAFGYRRFLHVAQCHTSPEQATKFYMNQLRDKILYLQSQLSQVKEEFKSAKALHMKTCLKSKKEKEK